MVERFDELKELLDQRRRVLVAEIGDGGRRRAALALAASGGATVQERNEEPIRLTFGKRREPAGKVTNAQVKKLRAHEQVTAQDGRAYDGAKTGNLRVKGGSARVHRRRLGLSGRQWRRQAKARRRGVFNVTRATRNRQVEAIGREWVLALGGVPEDFQRLQKRLGRMGRSVPRSAFWPFDWGRTLEQVVQTLEGFDDLGNPIAHDLGARDLGEHTA